MKSYFSRSMHSARFNKSLLATSLLLVGGSAAALLTGCSGGASSKNGFLNQNTGLYTAADQPVGNGVAHTFVDLKNGIPLRQGMEFTTAALDGLPPLPPDAVAPSYIAPMPTVTNGSPFTNVFLGYASGHPETNEPAHFHLAILIRPLGVTGEPFSNERAAVASNEVAPGFVRTTNAAQPTGVVLGGAGVIYDDPKIPAGQPADTSLGLNELYYASHLNGIVLGPTIDQLKSKQTIVQPIAQPAVYPRDGYYPTKWEITYDATRQVHILEMLDFIRAPKFVPPGS